MAPRKKYPKKVKFFIADDIRSDSPKPLLIGLFADDVVGLVLPADQPDPTKEQPVAIPGLSILASFIDCNGSFLVKTSLYGPDGNAIFENTVVDEGVGAKDTDGPSTINFVAKFMRFNVTAFGLYKFVIKLDDKDYPYEFSIVRHKAP